MKFLFFIYLLNSAQASVFEGIGSTATTVHHQLNPDQPFVAEFGIHFMRTSFPKMTDVVVENPQTSTQATAQYGTIQPETPDILVQTLFLQTYLREIDRFTVALKSSLPLNGLAVLDTGSIYRPEYVLYRQTKQRPEVTLFSGIDLAKDFRIGLGVDVGFSVTAQADVFLQAGSNQYSDQRIVAKMKPFFVPIAAVELSDWTASVRGENRSKLDLNASAGARVFGTVAAGINFDYLSSSTLYYQPWAFEISHVWQLSPNVVLRPSLGYELWTGFQSPAAVIVNSVPNNCNGQPGCTATFSPGAQPEYRARNIWVPAVGVAFGQIENGQFRLGYRYKFSIFESTPTGIGNYLDPPRHDGLIGYRFALQSGIELGYFIQGSRLVSQTVVKSNSTEIGATSPTSRGYQAGGWWYGAGLEVSIPFSLNRNSASANADSKGNEP
jgi:hypothetical protein